MSRENPRKAIRDLGPRARYELRRRVAHERLNNLANVDDGEGQRPAREVNANPNDADEVAAQHPNDNENLVHDQGGQDVNVRRAENDNLPQNAPNVGLPPNGHGNVEGMGDNDNNSGNEDEGEEQHESDGSDDDVEGFDTRGNLPLYDGAEVTVKEANVLMLGLMLRHNLTATCKYFSLQNSGSGIYKKHFYCSVCLTSLPAQDAECDICVETKHVSYFITLPFLKQLQEMFKRDNFYELLQHRFNRGNQRQDLLSDIYDGSVYKSQAQEEFLSNRNAISLMWYTDGVPVFKSSKTCMWPIWPIYLSINELPYKQRIRQENILLAGLWFGKKKTEANLYLTKLRPQFTSLFRGKNFTLPGGNIVTIRGILLAGTADVPAKTHFMSLTLYSGAWGCTVCKLMGYTFYHNTGGHSHVYPYRRIIHERTLEETIAHGRRVAEERLEEGIEGVKGLSALQLFMPNFLTGMATDPMHKIYGGTVKKLLYLWFDASYTGQPFSLRLVIANIDARLRSIKPPKHFHRMPHSITELCHWKCSELKMWFFYFALPLLSGIMLPLYFNHFSLFVHSICLLNADVITQAGVRKANKFIHKFVREFAGLYGERQLTINVHGLLHLPAIVSRLGGLYNYSCMHYEDLNGKLLRHIHGTSNLDSQVAVRHCQVIKLQSKLENLREGPVKDFVLN